MGNSLGGFVALQLAERERARSVVALAPAGGWSASDADSDATLEYFRRLRDLTRSAAPHVDAIVSTPEGRRRATAYFSEHFEHIPSELIAHLIRGAAACDGAEAMIDYAGREAWGTVRSSTSRWRRRS